MEKYKLVFKAGCYVDCIVRGYNEDMVALYNALNCFPPQLKLTQVSLESRNIMYYENTCYFSDGDETLKISGAADIHGWLHTQKTSSKRYDNYIAIEDFIKKNFWGDWKQVFKPHKQEKIIYNFFHPTSRRTALRVYAPETCDVLSLEFLALIIERAGIIEIYETDHLDPSIEVRNILEPVILTFIRLDDGAGGEIIVDDDQLSNVKDVLSDQNFAIVSENVQHDS